MNDTAENVTKLSASTSPSSPPPEPAEEPEEVEQLPAGAEQLPAIVPPVRYIVISVPFGVPPKALHAYNDKDICKLVRELRLQNDQQYLFVIRNGELGRLRRARRGLVIRFKEARLNLKVPDSEKYGPIPDGWIGD